MNRSPVPPLPAQVLALVEDAGAARLLLDISSALAQLLHRELHVVYVESAAALAAAELPASRVLAPATARWAPLAPPDLEQAWRVEAGRLRALVEQASLARAVNWSMRVMRGGLLDAAQELLPQSDLLLLAGALPRLTLPTDRTRRRTLAVLDDGSPAGGQALDIAGRLAVALGATLQRQPAPQDSGRARAPPADLLVLPRTLLAVQARFGVLRPPTLLVGTVEASGSTR